jgi:hypothetical protein
VTHSTRQPRVPADLRAARTSGQPIRLHSSDGEVVVARVLRCDEHEVTYTVLTSSHPERYAVCDSTGFCMPVAQIERTQLLQEPAGHRTRQSGRRDSS